MDAVPGTTYDDGLVRRTVTEVTSGHVFATSVWITTEGPSAGHTVRWTRQQWDDVFKGRTVKKSKSTP